MSFGKQDDEFLTINLKTLINNKHIVGEYNNISNIMPVLANYELIAGFVFKLALIPIAYDVSIGERYTELRPTEYSLLDHISIDSTTLDGSERLAFTSSDYARISTILELE